MPLEILKDLASIASFMLSVGAVIYAFFATRKKDTDQQFAALDKRCDDLEKRLSSTEQHISAAPTSDDIHGLQIQMERMSGVLGRMEAVMEGNANIMSRLESIVSRHEDHLLNQR